MTQTPERLIEDIQRLLTDIDELARAVLDDAGSGTTEIKSIQTMLATARASASELKDNLVQGVRSADQRVHDNAWKLMGVTSLIAFTAGLLVALRRTERAPMRS